MSACSCPSTFLGGLIIHDPNCPTLTAETRERVAKSFSVAERNDPYRTPAKVEPEENPVHFHRWKMRIVVVDEIAFADGKCECGEVKRFACLGVVTNDAILRLLGLTQQCLDGFSRDIYYPTEKPVGKDNPRVKLDQLWKAPTGDLFRVLRQIGATRFWELWRINGAGYSVKVTEQDLWGAWELEEDS